MRLIEPTSHVLWVLQALSRDPYKPRLSTPWIHDGYFYATDGHRIHRTNTDLKNMWLSENLEGVKSNMKPAKVDNIFPTPWPDGFWRTMFIDDFKVALQPWNVEGSGTCSCGEHDYSEEKLTKTDRFSFLERHLKMTYVNQIFVGNESMQVLLREEDSINLPVLFRSSDGKRQAAVMRIRP